MKNKWNRGNNPFSLPMSVTFGTHEREGKWIAHSLEFDLAASGTSKQEALDKLRLSVKTYVEYGLSKKWDDAIIFPAPDMFWERLNDDVVQLMKPIHIDSRVTMQVYVRNLAAAA
jgi:hypothetical protein